MEPKKLFQEDDALINGKDPDYRGVRGWWEETFHRHFFVDFLDAGSTEEDLGDCFNRTVVIEGRTYIIHQAVDGFSVYEVMPNVP